MIYRFFYLLLLFVIGCSPSSRNEEFLNWSKPNGKLKILSTTAMINDIVRQVGGNFVDTLTLIQGDLDPHSYQLVKGDDEKLARADIIFYNGLGLEHGPSLQHYLENNPKAIPVGDIIHKDSQLIIVDNQKDPHIWMDISLWAKTVPIIVEVLSQKDGSHAQEYQANGKKLQLILEDAHKKVREIMQKIPEQQRYLVTSHDAFNYFTRAYLSEESEIADGSWKKRFAAPEGLAPESQISPLEIKNMIDHMARYQIHVLFAESNVSRDSIKKIIQAGREKGLELKIACCVLYADAMGSPGSEGDSYPKMIQYNAKTIADHIK